MHRNRGRRAERSTSGAFGEVVGAEIPAIQFPFSRSHGTVKEDSAQRQETQIVQSCTTLEDFLPGFAGPATCHNVKCRCHLW